MNVLFERLRFLDLYAAMILNYSFGQSTAYALCVRQGVFYHHGTLNKNDSSVANDQNKQRFFRLKY